MAGLSIRARRRAWAKGVVSGAGAHTPCRYTAQKLIEIFERGRAYGQEHAASPTVRAIVEQENRRTQRQARPARPSPMQRNRGTGGSSASGRFPSRGGSSFPRNRGSRP